jgi:ATP-binding cassette, subfamily C, bacterial CydC
MIGALSWALGAFRTRAGWLALGMAASLLSLAIGLGLMAVAGAAAGGLLLFWWVRGLALSRIAARYLERLATHEAMFRALADLRVVVFAALAERAPLGPGFARAGEWLARLTSDVEALDGLYIRGLVPVGLGVAAGLAAAVVLWPVAPVAGLAALACVLLAVAAPVLFAAAASRAGHALAAASGALRGAAVEAVTGLRALAAYGGPALAASRFQAEDQALIAAQARIARLNGLASAAGMASGQGALLAAIALAGLGWQGGIEGGTTEAAYVAAALMLAVAALEPLGALPRAGQALATAAAAAARLRAATSAPAAVPDPATPGPDPADGALQLRGFSFAWRAGQKVLRGLDLDVPHGARVAIVAESGAGKSSLLAAMLKLAPCSGGASLGGVNLADLSGAQARKTIAALPQGAHLFGATLRDNFLLAAPGATEPEIWAALAAVAMESFVRGLPEGLDTWLGEAGVSLSGGQARRVALARTLLAPGHVLLLDEPCTGLDAATEAAVLAGLETVRRGRTLVLLLHRLTGHEALDHAFRLVDGKLERLVLAAPQAVEPTAQAAR